MRSHARRRASTLIFVLIMITAMASAVLGVVAFAAHVSGAESRSEAAAAAQGALDGALASTRSEIDAGTMSAPASKVVVVGTRNVGVTLSDYSGTIPFSNKVDVSVAVGGKTYTRSYVIGYDRGQGLAVSNFSSASGYFGSMTSRGVDGTVNISGSSGLNNTSARWTGSLLAPTTGNYTFTTTSDEGVRVWLDGNLIINNWTAHTSTNNTSASIPLTAGKRYTLRVDWYQGTGAYVMQLKWTPPSGSLAIIPMSQLSPDPIPLVSHTEQDLTSRYNADGMSYSGSVNGSFGSTNRTLPAELLSRHLRYDGVRFYLGNPANGTNNVVACDGTNLDLSNGSVSQLRLLMVSTSASHGLTFTLRYTDSSTSAVGATVYDWRAAPAAGEDIAVTYPYSYLSGATNWTMAHLQVVTLNVNSAKSLTSVDLPNNSSDFILAATTVN